jgi:hypothetical protein
VKDYARYGGAGITICAEWRGSFQAFIDHMGKRPAGNYSIDRIDGTKGYEPGNCRWATLGQQAINKRTVKLTKESVAEIMALAAAGASNRELHRKFGVAPATIADVRNGKSWRGVS